eukprot:919660-Pleurochrysis_carterae.AAC.1
MAARRSSDCVEHRDGAYNGPRRQQPLLGCERSHGRSVSPESVRRPLEGRGVARATQIVRRGV